MTYRYLRDHVERHQQRTSAARPTACRPGGSPLSSPGPVLRAPLTIERRPSEPGRSRFRITLPAARLPIVALELTVGGGHLLRDARVLEAGLVGNEAQPQLIGRARLTRVVREEMAADALAIPMRPAARAADRSRRGRWRQSAVRADGA